MDEFKNENDFDLKENSVDSVDEFSQYSQPQEEKQEDSFSFEPASQNEEQPQENTSYSTGYDYDTSNSSNYQGTASQGNPYQSNPYRANPYQSNQSYNPYTQQNNYNNYQPPKKPTSGKGKKVLAVLLAFFVILASIGIGTAIGRNSSSNNSNTVSGDSSTPTNDNAEVVIDTTKSNEKTSGNLEAVKKARDSVVGIVVYDSKGELAGEGSGVVMGTNEAGTLTYVITCAHVVSDDSVKSCGVLLEDGTIYEAKIVGYDERTDIGVISIKETGLQAATFGDSDALEVTETVYAIGNPGGSDYYGSVTNGIVSALDRSLTSTYTMQVIQHTAAISPGNSGGALVNSSGQVIGINSSKIAATDYEGIGFAVPIATAKPIVDSLIKYGYVPNRPKLGISYASVTNYQAYSMVVQIKGLPKGSVIIASISDDSSLAGSDVKVGDMITSVNGKDMDSSDVLLDVIDNAKVGDELTLGICRVNSRTYEVTTFTVKVSLVEDKGSTKAEEETTESSNLNPFGGSDSSSGYGSSYSDDWEDFFRQFFGQ